MAAATDLTQAQGNGALSGREVADVQQATLKAGRALLETWSDLEPIVKKLVKVVRTFVDDDDEIDGAGATKLLSQCATVVQRVGAAAVGVLRASEGMTKLALLLDVGSPKRKAPEAMTQKQLIGVVLEAVKQSWRAGTPCPTCGTTKPVEVA